jgi:hypothetical protein
MNILDPIFYRTLFYVFRPVIFPSLQLNSWVPFKTHLIWGLQSWTLLSSPLVCASNDLHGARYGPLCTISCRFQVAAALAGFFLPRPRSHSLGSLVGECVFWWFLRVSEVSLSLSSPLLFKGCWRATSSWAFVSSFAVAALGCLTCPVCARFYYTSHALFVMEFLRGSQMEFWLRASTLRVVSVIMYCAIWASIHFPHFGG